MSAQGLRWTVRRIKGERPGLPVEPGESVRLSTLTGADTWTVLAEPAGPGMLTVLNERTREVVRVAIRSFQEQRGDFRGPCPPDEVQVTWWDRDGAPAFTVSAETPEDLLDKLVQGGWVTEPAEALRVGAAIAKI